MKYIFILLFISTNSMAQAIYDANGQYKGYQQTSPSGVTNTYNSMGQNMGSSQIDNGQRNLYTHNGAYQGANTAPAYGAPNTPINTPRQVPQAPIIKSR